MPLVIENSDIPGVLQLRGRVHADERGWFSEAYKASEFTRAGIAEPFAQDNLSWSARRGTLRGLHFQRPPAEQGKLVRCLRGSIFDVVVDLRAGSPTAGRWTAFTLTADSGDMLWVPPGMAHGFQTLVDDCLVAYKTTTEYSPAHEGGIRWNDPTLAIPWPEGRAIMSSRDEALPLMHDAVAALAASIE